MTDNDPHQEIRDAVRALCREYPDEYFRKVDAEKAYPEAFVDALMEAGWLAAMIPEEYGGPGLWFNEATVIMEGDQSGPGGNSGARATGQMYNMGARCCQRQQGAEGKVPARSRGGKLRIQSMAVTEADRPAPTPTEDQDDRRSRRTGALRRSTARRCGSRACSTRYLMILLGCARRPLPADVEEKVRGNV
jgi:alkylation response protein AidB-like acyl-CoA dehydrogenase